MTAVAPPRLAVLTDFPEEGWPSMDLVAEMLLKHLDGSDVVRATRVCPPFKRRLGFLGGPGRNADRLLNRMWHYPRHARRRVAPEFDLFHLCDHSYAQLVHALPADRTGVLLHDLDTFRCLLDPQAEPRPKWFRAMARRILTGLQKARVVFYISAAVRDQLLHHNLLDPDRLVKAPPAAAEEFTYTIHAGAERPELRSEQRRPGFASAPEPPYLLHVGSCIARKRIDVLLETFAAVRTPGLKLVQVGGQFTASQRDVIDRHDLTSSVVQLRNLTRHEIADLYRRAAVVLQPSDAEGFGLPVVEALACGAPVVASDIPVLREVGGDAVEYCRVADLSQWGATVIRYVRGEATPPPLETRLAQAARFSWAEQARVIADTYRELFDLRRGVA